jgi:hypothetical protein
MGIWRSSEIAPAQLRGITPPQGFSPSSQSAQPALPGSCACSSTASSWPDARPTCPAERGEAPQLISESRSIARGSLPRACSSANSSIVSRQEATRRKALALQCKRQLEHRWQQHRPQVRRRAHLPLRLQLSQQLQVPVGQCFEAGLRHCCRLRLVPGQGGGQHAVHLAQLQGQRGKPADRQGSGPRHPLPGMTLHLLVDLLTRATALNMRDTRVLKARLPGCPHISSGVAPAACPSRRKLTCSCSSACRQAVGQPVVNKLQEWMCRQAAVAKNQS